VPAKSFMVMPDDGPRGPLPASSGLRRNPIVL
jgi:hypothetical protein